MLAYGKGVFSSFIVNGSLVVSSVQVLLHFPLDAQVDQIGSASLHGKLCRMASSELCFARCVLADIDTDALLSASEDAVASVIDGDHVLRIFQDVTPNLASFVRTNKHAVLSSTPDAHDHDATISSVPSTMADPSNRSSTFEIIGLLAVGKKFAAEDKSRQLAFAGCWRGVRTLDTINVTPENTRQPFTTKEHDCISQRLEIRCNRSFHGLTRLSIVAGYESLRMFVSGCEILETENHLLLHCRVGVGSRCS